MRTKDINSKQIGRVLIKYVKKAKSWCRTTFSHDGQKQEWFSTEEEAKKINI